MPYTGGRYGPTCVDRNFGDISTECPAVSITFQEDEWSGDQYFDIAVQGSDPAIDQIYFMFEFTLPLTEAQIYDRTMPGTNVFGMNYKKALLSTNVFLVGSNNLNGGLGANVTGHAYLQLDFNKTHYGYACIEKVDCRYCSGAGCQGLRDDLEEDWEEVGDGSVIIVYNVYKRRPFFYF